MSSHLVRRWKHAPSPYERPDVTRDVRAVLSCDEDHVVGFEYLRSDAMGDPVWVEPDSVSSGTAEDGWDTQFGVVLLENVEYEFNQWLLRQFHCDDCRDATTPQDPHSALGHK